jgi:accessory gene regulator protein AgrB
MLLLWVLIILASFAVLYHNITITFHIVEWEVDHTSPLDLCSMLNRLMVRAYIVQGILTALAAVQLLTEAHCVSAPVLAASVALLAFAYPKRNRRNGRYFDPSTIVRESGRMKAAHGSACAANFLGLLYEVFLLVSAIVRKNR